MGSRLKRPATALLIAWVLAGAMFCSRLPAAEPPPAADSPADAAPEESQLELMWANAACYVCHTTFVHEELSKVHLKNKTACIDCHGLSAAHANDEHIGATPPDITYARDKIDASCAKCHEGHDAPARDVIARWLERRPPTPAVCTDCHGTHRIDEADKKAHVAAQPKPAGSSGG